MINTDEILKNQEHYLNLLINICDASVEEVMYTYGPFLAMHNDAFKVASGVSYLTNPIYKLMLNASVLISKFTEELSIKEIKQRYLTIRETKEYPGIPEATVVKELCDRYLKSLKDTQYKGMLLESSFLNMSPIVPYQGLIKKPTDAVVLAPLERDLVITKSLNTNIDILLHILKDGTPGMLKGHINDLLLSHVIDILQDNENVITCQNVVIDDLTIPIPITDVVLHRITKLNGDLSYSDLYFILVYLHFNFNSNQLVEIASMIEVILNAHTTIYNGKIVDNLENVIEAYVNIVNI